MLTTLIRQLGALRLALPAVLCALLLAACASTPLQPVALAPGAPTRAELVDTPFFPDDSHFCGPAALATSLSAVGLVTTPAQLVGQVFLPGREGTLQIEMLSGARRQGAVAMVIPGTLAALKQEIDAGHPVVVLQNLGLSWAPSWHYAVVVGYDLERGQLLLRSGPMRRQVMTLRTFGHTWQRSQYWAFVALPPGRLPASVTEQDATRALVAFERNAKPATAVTAYRAARQRWPHNTTLAMGLGNALYASGDLLAAAQVFRDTAATHQLAAAYNNLARILLQQGHVAEARQAAEGGLALAGPLRATLLDTLRDIEQAAPPQPGS
ncbi:PA2778 family cysteine peptidase [Vogesella indigofera]|uniref:PA2778 family cysteine peptidase n=1 Tax=Vogesella indigofera TaxID=45465 RepID=A0ABT5I4M2_VOGIN|nr:PA2778 family cysteine peptidase [Vogesella indigofera]MDC7691126.1 PA2778 family cysteine peptidase [Vogesella indigofera]